MIKNTLLRCLSAIALTGSLLLLPGQSKKAWTDAEVMKIHKEAYLIDMHNDSPMFTVTGKSFSERGAGPHTDAVRIPSAYVATNSSAHQTLRAIEADSTAGILTNKKAGKMTCASCAASTNSVPAT